MAPVAESPRRFRRWRGAVAVLGLLLVLAALSWTPVAQAAWHLEGSFGDRGVAGLPLRERGIDFLNVPGPGEKGALLAPGPQGSLYVGGYARSKPGAFLVARLSAQGKLVRAFGDGGVAVVPAIYSTPQHPPRMLAAPGGRLLVVGLDRSRRLTVVRLSGRGRPDGGFAHAGVASHALAGAGAHPVIASAVLESDGDLLVVYFPREVPEPANEPQIQPGLGQGPLGLVRLAPTGALDLAFGKGGFLQTSAQPPATPELLACGVTAAPDGSVLLAYEAAFKPGGDELPAVQKIDAAGVDAPTFGSAGSAFLSATPRVAGVSSVVFGALFALPDGGAEVSFGGGGALARFTAAGVLDSAFDGTGQTAGGRPARSRAGARRRDLRARGRPDSDRRRDARQRQARHGARRRRGQALRRQAPASGRRRTAAGRRTARQRPHSDDPRRRRGPAA
jgi:hypothetical protein